MEKLLTKLRETIDTMLADLNGRAEEVKENFSSFREVFGKEFELQADNMKVYRDRLESKGKKIFDTKDFTADVREEVGFAIKDVRNNVDRFFDAVKDGINKVK